MSELDKAYTERSGKLFFYSPYNFLKGLDNELQLKQFVQAKIKKFTKPDSNHSIYTVVVNGSSFFFLYSYLPWDTSFFQVKTFKLYTVLYTQPQAETLTKAILAFREYIMSSEKAYCFIEIPAEDILLLQCLGNAGFRTLETRLTFYHDKLESFNHQRYPVRKTTHHDIATVGRVAAEMRNEYDRFHSDSLFSQEQGDQFLRAYAEATVNGYCDTVLVPAEPGLPSEAFLAISHLQNDSDKINCQLARIVLTAVAPSCKGWHLKLVSETTHYAKNLGARYLLMTTQATNRAVFRTTEKLGFKLGGTTLILSCNN
jgi:dTDP-4-amino-4,6-dideoxy-D-galactose acyltransferase